RCNYELASQGDCPWTHKSNSVPTWPVLIEDRVGEGTSALIAGRNNAIAVAPGGGPLRPRPARLSIGCGRRQRGRHPGVGTCFARDVLSRPLWRRLGLMSVPSLSGRHVQASTATTSTGIWSTRVRGIAG